LSVPRAVRSSDGLCALGALFGVNCSKHHRMRASRAVDNSSRDANVNACR
jgi:hypothetical protein